MSELHSCPFCGHRPDQCGPNEASSDVSVVCRNEDCPLDGYHFDYHAWQYRAPLPHPSECRESDERLLLRAYRMLGVVLDVEDTYLSFRDGGEWRRFPCPYDCERIPQLTEELRTALTRALEGSK